MARMGIGTLTVLLVWSGTAVDELRAMQPHSQQSPQQQYPQARQGNMAPPPSSAPAAPAAPPQRPPSAQRTQGPSVGEGALPAYEKGVASPSTNSRQPLAPFQLTPHQEAELDRALKSWEQASSRVKLFECEFHRFTYDPTFGKPDEPVIDKGELKYSAPDKGMFKVEGPRPEHWICNGEAIFEYKFREKQLVEHRLPPELRGKAIADGPLPFLFGTDTEKLKQRYFMRITTPREKQGQELWLEAYPRTQQDAANFQKADLILTVRDMQPFAVQIFKPGGVQREVYQFENVAVNQNSLFRFLKGDPFVARLPGLDWKHVVEEPPVATEARRP